MDSNNVEYTLIVRLEVFLAPPPVKTDTSDDSIIEDPSEGSSTYED